jgi:hypothetical protein
VWNHRGMSQGTAEGMPPVLADSAGTVRGRGGAVSAAALAAVLAVAVGAGAALDRGPYLLLVGAVQAVLVAAWWPAVRPSGRTGVVVVAAVAAVAADLAVLVAGGGTLEPVVAVVAAAFIATVLVQLLRGVGRSGVTEAFGSTMLLTICLCALAAVLALRDRPGGADVIAVVFAAAGAGLVVAHLADAVRPVPELSPGTGRGGLGVALGGAAGAVGAGVVAGLVAVPGLRSPVAAAAVGAVVALTAVLVDVGQDCATVGRERAGEQLPDTWTLTALGPAWGTVVASVGVYVVGNVVLG